MEIVLDSVETFIGVSYGALTFVTIWLVWIAPKVGHFRSTINKFWLYVARTLTIAKLIVPQVVFLVAMNNIFKKVFDGFKEVDVAADNIERAFNDGHACAHTFENVGSVLVHALFYKEYGNILDVLSYLDVFIPTFYGLGIFVLVGMLLIAVALWLSENRKLVFVMLIFLSFQIIFPGMATVGLGLLYYDYEPNVKSAGNTITSVLNNVPSVSVDQCSRECNSLESCEHVTAFLTYLNTTSRVLEPDDLDASSLANEVLTCYQYLHKNLCAVKVNVNTAVDEAENLGHSILVYNYVAIACLSLFVILAPYLTVDNTGSSVSKSKSDENEELGANLLGTYTWF